MWGCQSLSLCGNPASPLVTVRCSVGSVSGHGRVPPCPGATRLSRGARGGCGTRPLRPHASLQRNAPFCEVAASRCAEAPLGVAHRFAPSRVYKTGITLSGLRWVRSHSRQRSPVVGTPYAPPSGSLVAVQAPWYWSGASRSVLDSGLRPVMLCVPRPPLWASPRFAGVGPALGTRPPPRGSLSPAPTTKHLLQGIRRYAPDAPANPLRKRSYIHPYMMTQTKKPAIN